MGIFADDYEINFVSWYEPSNKVWGWFTTKQAQTLLVNGDTAKRVKRPREVFAFWAVIGKTITIKRHRPWQNNMDWLKRKKIEGKYVEITPMEFDALWTTFSDDIDQRMMLLRLSGELED